MNNTQRFIFLNFNTLADKRVVKTNANYGNLTGPKFTKMSGQGFYLGYWNELMGILNGIDTGTEKASS